MERPTGRVADSFVPPSRRKPFESAMKPSVKRTFAPSPTIAARNPSSDPGTIDELGVAQRGAHRGVVRAHLDRELGLVDVQAGRVGVTDPQRGLVGLAGTGREPEEGHRVPEDLRGRVHRVVAERDEQVESVADAGLEAEVRLADRRGRARARRRGRGTPRRRRAPVGRRGSWRADDRRCRRPARCRTSSRASSSRSAFGVTLSGARSQPEKTSTCPGFSGSADSGLSLPSISPSSSCSTSAPANAMRCASASPDGRSSPRSWRSSRAGSIMTSDSTSCARNSTARDSAVDRGHPDAHRVRGGELEQQCS